MSVKFIKDQAQDTRLMMEMFLPQTEDAMARAKEAGISEEELHRARGASSKEDAFEVFKRLSDARYQKDAPILDAALRAYQEAWDKIDPIFFVEVKKITGHAWQSSDFVVVVSLFHHGISNSNKNIVVRWAYEDAEDQKRITAHEILMIQMWHIFDQYFPEAEKDPLGHFWALNEITTVAVLGLEPSLNALWTPRTQGFDSFLQNYPQLAKIQSLLKETYQKRKSFLEYLHFAIGLLDQSYPNRSLESV